jgi:predicted PurR-regulated permease PerM
MKNDEKEQTININVKPWVVIRTVFLVIFSILLVGAVGKMGQPITLILISFFLAVALNPPVSRISKYMPKGSRALSVATAYLIVISILGGLIFSIVPPVAKQVGTFANRAPTLVDDIQNNPDSNTYRFIERFSLEDEVKKLGENVQNSLGDAGQLAFSSAQTAAGVLASSVTVLVLTFFMLVDGPMMTSKLFEKYKDEEARRRHKKLLKKMYRVVTGYFNGQVLITTITAASSLVAMTVFGWILGTPVPYALVLTAMVWILGLIPLVGATLGAFVVVGVSAFVNWKLALALGVFFVIYQQVENATIQPKIQSKAIGMSPLIVLIVVLLGASLGGILTAFIALPVAGCLQLLFHDYLSEDGMSSTTRDRSNTWLARTIRLDSGSKK